MSPIERHYRLLVRTYPPGPRRTELLDTLLDCAPPGKRWPHPLEIINLLRYGLRARLGRPGTTGVVVVATLAALAFAFFGAAAGNRLAWEFAPSLPTGQAERELKATVFPGLHVWGGGDADKFLADEADEGTRYGDADYWVEHTAATRDVHAYTVGVRDRLIADGWEIRSPLIPQEDQSDQDLADRETSWSFWATKDDLALSFSDVLLPARPWYDAPGAASFELTRTESTLTWSGAAAGALLSALAGWLLVGAVSRRTEFRPGATVSSTTLFGLAVLMLGPTVLLSLDPIVQRLSDPPEPVVTPYWNALTYLGDFFAVIAGCLALAALLVGLIPERSAWHRARRRRLPGAIAFVLVVASVVAIGWIRSAPEVRADRACTPAVPPPARGDTHLTRKARVFVRSGTSPEQLNLITVASRRAWGGVGELKWDPMAPEFQHTYCGAGASMPAQVAVTMPWYFVADLSSPGVFPALDAELSGMPGVIAVRKAERDLEY